MIEILDYSPEHLEVGGFIQDSFTTPLHDYLRLCDVIFFDGEKYTLTRSWDRYERHILNEEFYERKH